MQTWEEVSQKHPWLVKSMATDRTPFSMFYFECEAGWSDLIDELCTKIEKISPGGVSVAQIKEKFGGLRFYVDGATEKIYKIIDKYEKRSYSICEKCGQPGKLRKDLGWIRTLCHDHYKEHLSLEGN